MGTWLGQCCCQRVHWVAGFAYGWAERAFVCMYTGVGGPAEPSPSNTIAAPGDATDPPYPAAGEANVDVNLCVHSYRWRRTPVALTPKHITVRACVDS